MFKKIIASSKLSFEPKARLGLDTRWATNHQQFLDRATDKQGAVIEGEYIVKTRVSFPKGAVLWVDEASIPKDPATFEEVDMPRGYKEPDPVAAEKLAAALDAQKPGKAKAKAA